MECQVRISVSESMGRPFRANINEFRGHNPSAMRWAKMAPPLWGSSQWAALSGQILMNLKGTTPARCAGLKWRRPFGATDNGILQAWSLGVTGCSKLETDNLAGVIGMKRSVLSPERALHKSPVHRAGLCVHKKQLFKP